MSDEFSITGPDGQPASIEDLAQAMHEAGRAKDHEMSCPEIDCSGRIEAQCSIWFNIDTDGLPYVHGIGWFEGGKFACSQGGEAHVPAALEQRLWGNVSALCATLEKRLGSQTQEDALPGGQVNWSTTDGEEKDA